jgi:hypothetical protein
MGGTVASKRAKLWPPSDIERNIVRWENAPHPRITPIRIFCGLFVQRKLHYVEIFMDKNGTDLWR